MARQQPPNKAPAKSGAERLAEKRAHAKTNRERRAQFIAQNGEGHSALEDFFDAFKQYDDFEDPADIENLHHHTRVIALAIRDYLTHEARTLDEAFKVRRPDGYRRPAARKRYLVMDKLQRDGLQLRQHGAVVDAAFFELLAERHGVDKTTAADWYYKKHRGVKPVDGKTNDAITAAIRARLKWKRS